MKIIGSPQIIDFQNIEFYNINFYNINLSWSVTSTKQIVIETKII